MLNVIVRLCTGAAVLGLAASAWATDPASGEVSPAAPETSFTSGPALVSNNGDCSLGGCDDFALSVNLPANYDQTSPAAFLQIDLTSNSPADDFDMELRDANGNVLGSSGNALTPEQIIAPAGTGLRQLVVRVVNFAVAGGTATVVIKLVDPGPDAGPPVAAATGIAPRFKIHVSPPELGNDSGEPTLGYNPLTKRVMFIDFTNPLRVTFQENQPEPLPASCSAQWELKLGTITTLNTLDPIMTTDQDTGRTFNSQLSGANSLFEFSDDDGDTWTPGQVGPPNGGADHQGLVAGPYPEGQRPPTALYDNAIYYCSQSVVAAFCSRSDDGGQTFGPGFPFKNDECSAGGLHGHPKVAPDGTLYVPDSSQCVLPIGESAEKVVAFVSEDAGQTYDVRPILDSAGGAGSDPSIAIATDGTLYMCYEDGDGKNYVSVSHDKGETWINRTDVGAAAKLVHTRFPAMIAGDGDRAACAFLGTSTAEGDPNDLSFEGVWYGYIATTYDGGETWHLENVTPNDPVQGFGGVGPDGTNRNLLDFNDLELDEFGRPLFAYADGCIGGCVQDPSKNSFGAKGTIVRQSGGRTLFAEFDDLAGSQFNSAAAIRPAAACASQSLSKRTNIQTLVAWEAPDNGGSPITNYQVFRANSAAGPFAMVGNAGAKTQFIDASADPAQEFYYYRIVAVNAVGQALESNVIELPITVEEIVDTCVVPGEVIATDATGDGAGDDTDIEFVAVAEPADFEGNFVITMKMVGFAGGQPAPTSFYVVLFPSEDNLYIALDSTQGPIRYTFGNYADVGQGVLAFTEAGELDERSSFAADGSVFLVTPKSIFGSADPGDIIAGFDARVRVGSQSATSRDTAGPADYTVRGTAACAAAGILLADLRASRNSGSAPLDVSFTIGGQPSAGETLESWSIQFGDGQSLEDQPFNGASTAAVSHTYQSTGTFPARVTVTDSSGASSTNVAQQFIEVGTGGGVNDASGDRFGGSGSLLIWLGLLLGVMARRPRSASSRRR